MDLSNLLEFFDEARKAETWARKTKGQLIWFSGDNKRAYDKKPLLHIGDLNAVGFVDVGFRHWSAGISISDDGLAAQRRSASAQVVIDCRASLKPSANPAIQQRIVQWLIDQDRVPLALAIRRVAEQVLIAERDRFGGSFAEAMAAEAVRRTLDAALEAKFQQIGFETLQVSAVLADRGEVSAYDFQDEDVGLEVRLAGGLNATRVRWLARLRASDTSAGRAARSAYRGGFLGKIGTSYTGGIPGQLDPVEAWLAKLIADALSVISMETFLGDDPTWKATVREAVSQRLERGTGFTVDELEIKPSIAPPQMMPFARWSAYEITGTPGRALRIEHRMQYRMIDEAAWKSAGSPDPEAEILRSTYNIVMQLLQPMRYGDVVEQLHDEAGAKAFGDRLEKMLRPIARHFGHEVSSIVCILHIPDAEYLTGKPIEIPEQDYHLRDAGQTVRLGAEIEVQVNPAQLTKFAAAQTSLVKEQVQELLADDDDKLENRIRVLVHQSLRRALQSTNASAYYRSEFTSGDPDSAVGDAGLYDDATVEADLRKHAQAELAELGLEVVRLKLRVADDPIIRRMHDLRMLPVPIDMPVAFEGRSSQLAGDALVRDFSRDHWQAFYHNARRYQNVNDHVDHIRRYLSNAIGQLKAEFAEGEAATRAMIRQGNLQKAVATALEASVGIIVEIAFLHLEVPADFDPTFHQRRIAQAEDEIIRLEGEPSGFDDDERSARIVVLETRIKKLREEVTTGRKGMKSIALIANRSNEARGGDGFGDDIGPDVASS